MNQARISLRNAGTVALVCATTLAATGASALAASGASAARTATHRRHAAHRSSRSQAGDRGHSHPHRAPRVTVKVLGSAPHYKQLLKRTVTLKARPVAKDGGSCAGNTAAGALQDATKGRWSGTWNSEYADWEVTKIEGLKLAFNSKSSANWYWSLDVDGKEASAGICDVTPKRGQTIEFKPACYGKSCPKAKPARVKDATDRRR